MAVNRHRFHVGGLPRAFEAIVGWSGNDEKRSSVLRTLKSSNE